jgi:RNA polymerase-binding transcription factor DksA
MEEKRRKAKKALEEKKRKQAKQKAEAARRKAALKKQVEEKKRKQARLLAERERKQKRIATERERKRVAREKLAERKRIAKEKLAEKRRRDLERQVIIEERKREQARKRAAIEEERREKQRERDKITKAKEAERMARESERARIRALRDEEEARIRAQQEKAMAKPVKPPITKLDPIDGITPTKEFDIAFLKSQRALLLEKRIELVGQAKRLTQEAQEIVANQEMGDVDFGEEGGEGDTMVVERERDLILSDQALAEVEAIDAALQRMEIGEYGYSSYSGLPIPRERLEVLPWATELVTERAGGLGSR